MPDPNEINRIPDDAAEAPRRAARAADAADAADAPQALEGAARSAQAAARGQEQAAPDSRSASAQEARDKAAQRAEASVGGRRPAGSSQQDPARQQARSSAARPAGQARSQASGAAGRSSKATRTAPVASAEPLQGEGGVLGAVGSLFSSDGASAPRMGGEDAPDAVYDARTLGAPKMAVFGFQHLFAMFGATVLVPILTGLSVQATLLFAGLGTLFFHFVAKGKVPAFLGSSFAFIAGYHAIAGIPGDPSFNAALLPYACFGVMCAGLVYFVLSYLFKVFGPARVMRYFPPIVTGPIVIAIGLILASSAIANCSTNWLVAIIAIATIFVCNLWGRGMIRIIPILMGVIVAYVCSALLGEVDWTSVAEAPWIGLPIAWESTVFGMFGPGFDAGIMLTAFITITPLSVATMIEHIGDMSAISSTCNRNFIAEPGLHRTLLGDGVATVVASIFGAPANTTYGENTGVLALTKVFDPRVVRIAAVVAIVLSFCPKFAAIIGAMPAGVIGGVSLVLYGMISAVGIRNLVENNVDFMQSRNILICAIILVLSIGIAYSAAGALIVGPLTMSGLAVGALVGIILNAFLPGRDDGTSFGYSSALQEEDIQAIEGSKL